MRVAVIGLGNMGGPIGLLRGRMLIALAQGLSESDWVIIARISRKEAGL